MALSFERTGGSCSWEGCCPPWAAGTPSEIPPQREGLSPESRWDCLEPLIRPATLSHRLLPPPHLYPFYTAPEPRSLRQTSPPHPRPSFIHSALPPQTHVPTHAPGDSTVSKAGRKPLFPLPDGAHCHRSPNSRPQSGI